MKHYFGSHWSETVQGLHTGVWLDENGAETAATYNVMDSTGDHDVSKIRRKDAKIKKEIKTSYALALKNAEERKAYADARRVDTSFEHLQYCFLVTKGRGGVSWYKDESPDSRSKVSGYAITEDELREIDRLGIPFVDSTTIPDDLIIKTIGFPMFPSKPEESDTAPWGSLSVAPISVVAALYARIGATVRNITLAELSDDMFRSNSAKEALAIQGWFGNRPELIGEAMMR